MSLVKSIGRKVVGKEITAKNKQTAIKDIHANGYTISRNKLLPSKYFDNVMNATNANSWDWADATKSADKELSKLGV